jgi:hypothetical protein
MLRLAMEENRLDRQIGDHEAAILVVVMPTDEQTGYNPLTHVAERIKVLFGETAVAVEGKDGEQAREEVKRFKDSSARWIVSKDMITEGTSIPRIRTILILRDIKSPVRFDQTVHRATRNRSERFAQDAKVILFHLPEMMIFVGIIEDEIRLVIPKPKPKCPGCAAELEFSPRRGQPCPFCSYEPEAGSSSSSHTEFEWLFSKFGEETVKQGGEDFSRYDPLSRVVIGKLGRNPHYGGRHGINEIFRAADEANLINLSDAKPTSPFSDDEKMERWWDAGRKLCERTAGIVSRSQGLDYQEVLRRVTAACKREAGMGRDKKETVMREYKDPVGTFQRFYEAAERALRRAQQRDGNAA